MPVYFRRLEQHIIIFGDTYQHRTIIKGWGGRFNGSDKSWYIPYSDIILDKVREFTTSNGGCQLPDASPKTAPIEKQPEVAATTDNLTVSSLLAKIDGLIRVNFPQSIWVIGEAQNISHKTHMYFQLAEQKDDDSRRAITVDAVIWRSQLQDIITQRGKDFIQEGLKVRCLCAVQIYRDRGAISLHVLDVDSSYGLGQLALEREKLLRKIRQEGLEKKNKLLKIPRFPLRIGLITADGSRACSDFCHQLEALAVPAQIYFLPTPMQGEETLTAVPRAIEALQQTCDLLVLTRGGGSASDLRWFDMAEIAYAIVHASVPIVAAIGHHDDLCVSEEVCCMRQKTPTAAADYIAELFNNTYSLLQEYADEMTALLQRRLQLAKDAYSAAQENLFASATVCIQHFQRAILQHSNNLTQCALDYRSSHNRRLLNLAATMSKASESFLLNKVQQLHAHEKTLMRYDPRPWLERGWTRLYDQHQTIKSITQVQVGSEAKAVLQDGKLTLQINKIEASDGKKSNL
ncbi:MAG: exodeoxyribonuclease VII large subunit [Pseudomonadota bacterium]|nr:exodeoxyribonuclease VII large subunit [Pseudomonadota bacterium]